MQLDRLFLVITSHCNGRCQICNYWRHPTPRHLPLDFIKENVITIVKRYRIRLVIVTGGEPTLHPDLPDIVRRLKSTGATVTLITNGSYLESLYPLIENSIDAILLSLDATNEELHHSMRGLANFNQLLQYPAMIKKRNPLKQVAFSCVLQKRNAQHISEYYHLLAPLPIDSIFFNVPELKPHCFGRPGGANAHLKEQICPTQDQLGLMAAQFREIDESDRRIGLLSQGRSYFSNCLHYLLSLIGEEESPNTAPCSVPSNSVVLDEREHILPCFYLPFSFPLSQTGDQSLDHPTLRTIRQKVLQDSEFRRRHCGFCLQFQG